MSKLTVDVSFAPEGATHAILTRGFRTAGGMYQCSIYFYKKVGNTVYYFSSDNDNEYPEWVKRPYLPAGVHRIR